MRTLHEKLGLRAGERVALIGLTDLCALDAVERSGVEVVGLSTGAGPDTVLFQVEESHDLIGVAAARRAISETGALWIMWPKGRPNLRQSDVRRAGLDAGLVDAKVTSVSDRVSGLKFVYRLADR